MADWQTVRYGLNCDEPLDEEIIPICDALNAYGFVTDQSCWGHGYHWPKVWFEHSSDERIEDLARFIKSRMEYDYCPYSLRIQKEIRADDYLWSIEIHSNNVFADTQETVTQEDYRRGLASVTALIEEWGAKNSK